MKFQLFITLAFILFFTFSFCTSIDDLNTKNVRCLINCRKSMKKYKHFCKSICGHTLKPTYNPTVLGLFSDSEKPQKTGFYKYIDNLFQHLHKSFKTNSDSEQNKVVVDNGEFWERYRQQLIEVLTKGHPGKYLQVLTTPIDALWDKDASTSQLKTLCNTVPYWSPYYSQSPYTIDSQYKEFINNIDAGRNVKDQSMKKMYDQTKIEYEELAKELTPKRTECLKKFIKETPQNKKKGLDSYVQSCLGNLRDKLVNKKYELRFYETLAYGVENEDLQNSRMDVEEGTDYFEAIGSLSDFRKNAKVGKVTSVKLDINFFSKAPEKPLQWKDIKGITRKSILKQRAFASLIKNPKVAFQTLTSRFKMKMEYKGYTVVRASPGKWFRHSLIEKFKNGPFIHKSKSNNLFGPNGTCRLKPTAFYLVYQPTLYLYMDKKDSQQFLNYSGRNKGGFFSSSSKLAILQTTKKQGDLIEIKVSSTNSNPEIVAIDNELLG